MEFLKVQIYDLKNVGYYFAFNIDSNDFQVQALDKCIQSLTIFENCIEEKDFGVWVKHCLDVFLMLKN